MRRLAFLLLTLVLAAGAWALDAGTAMQAEAVELKLAHFMPPVHIQHRKNFVPFAEKVKELSGGEVTIKIYPGGTLGGPKQLYDACKTGITDIAFIIPSYVTGRFPRCSVFELPGLFDNAVHLTKSAYKVYDAHLARDFDEVKLLYMYAPGLGQFHTTDKPVLAADDLKGLKMRSPNALMSKALKALGADPVGMPISKLAISLQKGVINGVLTPYSAISDFKLFDLVGHVTEVNLYGTFMCVVMNKKKFEALSPKGRKAILEAANEAWGVHVAANYDGHDKATIDKIKAEGKIKLYVMPDAELTKINAALAGMHDEWIKDLAKKGIDGAAILKAVKEAAQATR